MIAQLGGGLLVAAWTIAYIAAMLAIARPLSRRLASRQPSERWGLFGLIIVVATLGRFGGTVLAARLTGQSPRDAACLGTLMNTRGLMELIVVNIGLDLGVISPVLRWLHPAPDGSAASAGR